jgi:hypothetical protein
VIAMARRLVTDKEAAEEIGIPLATFRSWVAARKLPQAIPEVGKWDLRAIDAALDRISGLGGGTNPLDAWRARGGNAR